MLKRVIGQFAYPRGVVCALMGMLLGMPASAEIERWGINMTEGVTAISREVYGLHMLIFWICVVIGVIVFGVMIYSMIAHRKSTGRTPSQFHESTTVEIVWTIIPFLILVAIAIPSTTSLIRIYDTADADMDILVTGYQWKWKYEYVGEDVSFFSNLATPRSQINNEEEKSEFYLREVDEPLVIPTHKKVRFLITGNDVIHSWWLPAFSVKRDAIPGFVNEASAIVEVPGTYYGNCAELCGKDHAFMPVVVKAVPEEEYNQWLAQKKQEAAELKALTAKEFTFEELYARGEEVYNASCAACHQVNGAGVPGVFPALKNSPIALGNMRDHIDVVVNGSATNPAMQAYGEQLSPVDLAAVILYERNAWGNNMGDMLQPVDIHNFKQGK